MPLHISGEISTFMARRITFVCESYNSHAQITRTDTDTLKLFAHRLRTASAPQRRDAIQLHANRTGGRTIKPQRLATEHRTFGLPMQMRRFAIVAAQWPAAQRAAFIVRQRTTTAQTDDRRVRLRSDGKGDLFEEHLAGTQRLRRNGVTAHFRTVADANRGVHRAERSTTHVYRFRGPEIHTERTKLLYRSEIQLLGLIPTD